MIVLSNTGGIASTNAYVLADEATGEAVLIDAPNDTVGPLLDQIEERGWKLKALWLTHGHFDHTADHAVVTKRFPDAQVLIHPLDEPMLQHPKSAVFTLPFTIPPRSADAHFSDQQDLTIGNIPVKVIRTPGHSPGHVAFYLPTEKTLMIGDLILMNSVGRTDLPNSNQEHLFESLRSVMKLPHETKLLSGHGDESTLAEELMVNPYVQHAMEKV